MQATTPSSRRDGFPRNMNQGDQAFCNLRGEASARFDAMGMCMSYCRGEVLFAEGELAPNIFILRSGRIKLSVTSRDGKTIILKIAEGGQILGLSAALTSCEHEVSAEALEPCCVMVVRTQDFLHLLENYPEAAKEATRCVLKEYKVVFLDICRLALPETVAGRVADLLLDWLKGSSQSGQSLRLTMGLTHEEIAAMLGTSRETVSRVLMQFQREKIVSIEGSSLTVLRLAALEHLAG
jgi:CRP/FNR family transcriptional regulator, cyclic AMP receptor protein